MAVNVGSTNVDKNKLQQAQDQASSMKGPGGSIGKPGLNISERPSTPAPSQDQTGSSTPSPSPSVSIPRPGQIADDVAQQRIDEKKSRAQTAMMAKEAQKARERAKEKIAKPARAATIETGMKQEAPKKNERKDERPPLVSKGGLDATGYVDAGTGEIVETTNGPSAYFAPPTMDENRGVSIKSEDGTFFQPGTQISEGARIMSGARVRPRSDSRPKPKQEPARPSTVSEAIKPDLNIKGRRPAEEKQEEQPQRSQDEAQIQEQPAVPIDDNDSIFYRNIRREVGKNGEFKNTDREDYNAHMKNVSRTHDFSKEFPRRRKPVSQMIEQGELSPVANKYDMDRYRWFKNQERNQSMFLRGYLPIDGMSIDEDGSITYTSIVQHARDQIKDLYACSDTDLNRLVIERATIGIDMNDEIMKNTPTVWRLTEDQFVAICQQIMESQRLYGHPLGLLPGPPLVIASSYRYPSGYMTMSLATNLTKNKKSVLYGKNPLDLMNEVGEHWQKRVYPTILANTDGEKINQRYAIENQMRALCALDSIDPTRFGITSDIARCLDEFMIESQTMERIDPSNASVEQKKRETFERDQKSLEKRIRRKPIKDPKTGAIVGWETKQPNKIVQALYTISNVIKVVGVLGSPSIIISGMIEHGLGNLVAIESNMILGAFKGKDYRIDKFLRQSVRTDEAKEMFAAATTLYNVGGMEALNVFLQSDITPSKKNVQSFLDQYVRGIADPEERSRKLSKFNEWTRNVVDKAMPGDWGFMRGMDTQRWLEMFMINMAQNKDSGRPNINTEQAIEAIRSDGVAKFMAQAMMYQEGRDAFVATKNQNLSRISPTTNMINTALRSHGVTNWLIVSGLDTYVTYGVNQIQVWLPLSNTISYLATRGITRTTAAIQGKSPDTNSIARENQLGGNDQFLQGLFKNLVYDSVRFANNAVMSLIIDQVLDMIGFDDPEDDDPWTRGMFDEYVIGRKIGLELRIRPAWWMSDILGPAWPMAIAMQVYKNHPDDQQRAVTVFWDGVHEMISGSSVLDAMKFILNAEENIAMMDEMSKNPDANIDPNDWISETSWMVERYMATILGKLTPGVLKRGYEDPLFGALFMDSKARERTPFKVYDREEDSEDSSSLVNVDDDMEVRRRRIAQNNPLYAILMNVIHNGYLFDDGTKEKTGYLFYEQPVYEVKDGERASYIEMFDFDPNDPAMQSEEAKDAKAEELITFIGNTWKTPEQAIANGFAIGYNARKNAIEYCYKQILLAELDYAEKGVSGYYKTFHESKLAEAKMKQRTDYYYDILKKYLQNDNVPWRDEGYEKVLTDYQVYYTWKDSGKPATAWDALWFGSAVEKRYEPYGNYPTNLLPFTVVDTRGKGYNAETIPNWYIEGLTDTEAVFEQGKDMVIPYGQDKGKTVADVYFGGRGDGTYAISPDGVPTMGHRGYVASEDSLPDSLKNIDRESIAEMMGIDLEELDNNKKNATYSKSSTDKNNGAKKNYNTWRSYGGGSSYSSSSYNPKIYSNSRSVSADRAASIYVKQPYGATINYLRPGFKTKGSREAYVRQDF